MCVQLLIYKLLFQTWSLTLVGTARSTAVIDRERVLHLLWKYVVALVDRERVLHLL